MSEENKKMFARKCCECGENTVFVFSDDKTQRCQTCGAPHTVEWLPKVHAGGKFY